MYNGMPKPGGGRRVLTFNKDDFVTVTRKEDDWWEGRRDRESGWFPAQLVNPVSVSGLESGTNLPLMNLK